jgi:hypothetical protein
MDMITTTSLQRGLPSTWIRRSLRIEYEVGGEVASTTGALVETNDVGLILRNQDGDRFLLPWSRLIMAELIAD